MLLLLACVRTSSIGEEPAETGLQRDSTPDSGSTDSGDTADSADPELCPLPVPGDVVVPGPVSGETNVPFSPPTPGWALATLHASRQIEAAGTRALPPSWFFAIGMQWRFMDCGDYGDPWDSGQHRRGCMNIYEFQQWVELTRLHPDWFVQSEYADKISPSADEDRAAAGVWTTGWYLVSALPEIGYERAGAPEWVEGLDDADWWLVSALIHRHTAWTEHVGEAYACDGEIVDCVNEESGAQVAAATAALHDAVAGGSCYDEPLTEADVEAYIGDLEDTWPELDWDAARAAQPALTGSFQADAGAVLDAIDDSTSLRMHCSGSGLQRYYSLDCW